MAHAGKNCAGPSCEEDGQQVPNSAFGLPDIGTDFGVDILARLDIAAGTVSTDVQAAKSTVLAADLVVARRESPFLEALYDGGEWR
jgi:hypothetical protein